MADPSFVHRTDPRPSRRLEPVASTKGGSVNQPGRRATAHPSAIAGSEDDSQPTDPRVPPWNDDAADAPIAPGTRLGEYEILEVLGAGGMGVAYRAFDIKLKRTVALKALRHAITDAPGIGRRLLREARAAAALTHPNICTIHSIADEAEVPYIVMEYVKGRTLAEVIRTGPMNPMEATSLALQVVDALDTAHRSGIVHRDIKPANIMVTEDGQVKVLDFGLAAPVVAEAGPALSLASTGLHEVPGAVGGTVGYMSPEHIEGRPLDGRTDLFSLGVVLYELCSGRHPFITSSSIATIARVLTQPATPIVQLVPGFPERLDRIILRCLEKAPEHRYASAAELLADLRHGATTPLWRRRDVQSMPSVAVLPFANLSGDANDDYVSDGVTSELTTRLAQAGHLLVISRISSMRYREARRDVREIGHDLGVRTLVEGSLRMRDGTCLLSANLIDVETGFHLWAGTYETAVEGLFDVESEIADRITTALSVGAREATRAAPAPARDPKALESYLRAMQAYYKFSSADNLIAIELLHQAIERDPGLAKAHALLANACLARVERGWEANVVQWMGLALQASSDALRLDAGISEAYSARGLISFFSRRNDEAEADAREALRVDTNNDIAHDLLGRIRFARGEFMGAIAAYRDALAINPYYVWCLNDLAWALMVTGAEEEATRTLDRVLLLSPTDEGGHCGKAAMHLVYGRAREALSEIRKAQEVNPHYPWVLQLMPPILARNGMAAEAIAFCEALRAAGGDAAWFGNASLGLVCLETGDRERVAECMRRAMEQVPFYPALDFSYASLYHAAGEVALAEEWVRKGVEEGIRLVEVNQWHPTLRSLAEGAGLISQERRPWQ